VGEEFVLCLKEAVSALTNFKKISVITAIFQADSVMASNILHNKTDILVTSDSDQAAILGSECICIKNFKIKEQKQEIRLEELEIFFCRETYIRQIIIINPLTSRFRKSIIVKICCF
jgi:hypothetical protein